MSAHRLHNDLALAATIADPGSAGTIFTDKSLGVVDLVTAAAEARTLADPVANGQILTLNLKTDGGDATITTSTAYDENGSTSIVFANTGEYVKFISIPDPASSGDFVWRITSYDGATGPTLNFATVDVDTLQIGGTAITASAAEINSAADVSGGRVALTDADATLLVANSGKPHIVANVSADRTFTLPAEADGLVYELIADVSAADGHDWIIDSGANANYFTGSIVSVDTDGAPSVVAVIAPDGNSNSKLQVNLPQGGTVVKLVCDGTLWNVSGIVMSTVVPAFADQ